MASLADMLSQHQEDQLILVDLMDRPQGSMGKLACHQKARLHRAFSLFLYRGSGDTLQLLLQRRAQGKYHSGGLLANSVCSHPRVGEALADAVPRRLTQEQIASAGFAPYFVDHTAGVYPQAASGTPWSAATMAVTGDPIADLTENLAAEQKARVTYDNILRISDDPDVNDAIRFLREREVVHFQRFGEAMELLRQRLDEKNVYYMNPALNLVQ